MKTTNLQSYKITDGVYWVEAPALDLRILCGCPAEVVKHLSKLGYIRNEQSGDITYETGPNVILLSDLPIQNGMLANMAEFPVLQMLYRQGMIIPEHPNNTGVKPLLLGTREELERQLKYIHRGNYGLLNKYEILNAGIDAETAEQMMAVKLAFAFGNIQNPDSFLDTKIIGSDPVTLARELQLRRTALNQFEFSFDRDKVQIDLNLPANTGYMPPYMLQYHEIARTYFSVVHSGEGDGWDINRPSMSSILMYQGECFLIDAPPNIDQILTHLGIDLSEVKGIFHTHAHDDHFAGLTTLMRAGHRIKYYATALVRNSVSKKLSALTGIKSTRFDQFFDVQNLVFDHWNDCEGLEVKPLYSPHPVENNIFLFRTLGQEGYYSYAHWADLTSFQVLDNMATSTEFIQVSPEFIQKAKDNYLIPANIKKLDIGGGMIHGMARDFQEDSSDRIILAHTDRPLSDAEREIGSSATFGTEDCLIYSDQDFNRQHAYKHLRSYFPDVTEHRIRALLNVPMIKAIAGTILLRRGEKPDHVYLIVTGSVEYVEASTKIRRELSTGGLIGEKFLFEGIAAQGTYRTLSHATLLKIPQFLLRTFLEAEGLVSQMRKAIERIDFLRTCPLFSERVSNGSLNKIVVHLDTFELKPEESLEQSSSQSIYIVREGEIELIDENNIAVERITERGFFGEEIFFLDSMHQLHARAVDDNVVLLKIEEYPLDKIPVVFWKMLEAVTRRRSQLITA